MPRACLQVFTRIDQHPQEQYTVLMSIVQLYTERIQVSEACMQQISPLLPADCQGQTRSTCSMHVVQVLLCVGSTSVNSAAVLLLCMLKLSVGTSRAWRLCNQWQKWCR